MLMLLVKAVIVALLLLGGFAYLMLFERKILAWFQLRLGPNRLGPWGLLQPLADGAKMILKEDIIPKDADRFVFSLAPIISVFVALAGFAIIPIAPEGQLFGKPFYWGIANPNAGVLVFLAIASLAVYGVALAGWSSQSKYPLLGALRASAQTVSYELSMAMSLVAVVLMAGSVNLNEIIAAQGVGLWNVLLQPVGFLIFFIAGIAECNRAPFDLPEAETELVAGYNTEYSGIRFAMFVIAEYVHMITVSALVTHLYLGGWHGPFLPPVAWFLLKVSALLFVFIWIRATLPRLRYDQLMSFGWKVMIPLATANLVYAALMVVYVL